MKKFLIAITVLCFVGFSLAIAIPMIEPDPVVLQPTTQPAPQATLALEPSIESQLGQLFMIGHWAGTPVASTTALIKKYQLGGVVIMSAPENPQAIAQWVIQWNAVSDTPLFISIDQEGGPVTRLKGEQFIQTSQREIDSAMQAYAVGRKRGQELSQLGINMNFAPVLDTAKNPTSFLYSRTFSDTTKSSQLAAALVAGMRDSSVIGVIKHFPGHDDTSADSHAELPVVNISRDELNSFTQPFANTISQDPPIALMTAHVQFPKIDSLPATLSPFFLTTYLRGELGYTGLIVTDDMSMDAIDSYYNTNEASKLAIEAGANIILLAAEPTAIETVFPFLLTQKTSAPVLRDMIASSYQRIVTAKETTLK